MNAQQNPPSNETTTAGKEPAERETVHKLDPLLWFATAAKQSAERFARTGVTSPGKSRITGQPQALAQVWTDPESDHPGPSIVITTHGVDPATRVPAHPRYRDWLPHHHGDPEQDILASAATTLDAAGWSLLCPWSVDDVGWRATVVRQPPITHSVTDFAPKTQRDNHTRAPRGRAPMKDLTAIDRRLGEALAHRDEALLAEVADEFAVAGLPAMAQLLRERGTTGASELLTGMSALTVAPILGTLSPASARLVAPMQARRLGAAGPEMSQ